ncbi:MAG: single-stranded-DNA-specific exonuclease RecJ [Solirubrobacterales bacterium]
MSTEAPRAEVDEIGASRLNEPPEDIAPTHPLIELPEFDFSAVRALQDALDLHPLAAQTLVSRGITSIDEAVEWRDGGSINDPADLPGAPAAAGLIADHLRAGTRIAVHGDYDVDGVSSTAIMVRALAKLGADVTWHVPSRFGEGYGLSRSAIDRLCADGVGLIIAVDCGIGAIDEAAHARSLGLDMVICDHHTIGDVLPDAAVVHPALGDYPDPQLCASAATFKLAQLVTARAGTDPASIDDDLALVALATVCDVVPLRGENRVLVREGLVRMRGTQNPGLRELMRVAGIDQLKISATTFGFALGPRINAAGRMHSAEPAVEMLLTSSESRAAELASGLAAANQRRRETEQEILFDAESQAREQRDKFAIVVAGEGWHPGVLGIVAGRLAERYHRPAIALGIENGVAAGSGRSGGSYDLHGGLAACSDLLVRWGGHRAAAGLELDVANLAAFRSALIAHATDALTPDDLRPHIRVDAIGVPADVNLGAVEALDALGPFGSENPVPRVLMGGVELLAVSRLGKTGQHFKLAVRGAGTRAAVVAFRQERAIAQVEDPTPVDVVVELQRNEFNGRVEAQAVLAALIEHPPSQRDHWADEFRRALLDPPFVSAGDGLDESRSLDRRDVPLAATLLEFSGRAAVAVNDPVRWRGLIDESSAPVLAYDDPRLGDGEFEVVVMAEPPPAPGFCAFGDAGVVLAWSAADAESVAERCGDLLLAREHMVDVFRIVRECGADAPAAHSRLRAELPSARIAGRAVRALEEIEVISVERRDDSAEAFVVHEGPKRALEQSVTFRSYSEYVEESQQWLRQLTAQQT